MAQVGNGLVHAALHDGAGRESVTVTGPHYDAAPRGLSLTLLGAEDGGQRSNGTWTFSRPRGTPMARATARDAGTGDMRAEVLWFCEPTAPRLWALVSLRSGGISLEADGFRVGGTFPRNAGALCVDSAAGTADWRPWNEGCAVCTTALASWEERTAQALVLEASDPAVADLVADWKAHLLVQQDRRTGLVVPMLGSRTTSLEESMAVVAGLLRLGLWEDAGRVLDAWTSVAERGAGLPRALTADGRAAGGTDDHGWPWLVLGHHWHWRASGDRSRIVAHGERFEDALDCEGRTPSATPTFAAAVRRAISLQAVASFHVSPPGGDQAAGRAGARRWLERFAADVRALDAAFWREGTGRYGAGFGDTPTRRDLAPAVLGLFTGGRRFERHARATADLLADVDDAATVADLVVVESQLRSDGRSRAIRALVEGAVDEGGNGIGNAAAPFDPAVGSDAIDGLLFGLTGTRTKSWGTAPARILPLHLFLPDSLTWFRVRGLARDGWRIDAELRAEERRLTPGERQALARHPALQGMPEEQLEAPLHLLPFRVTLAEDPPAGAWQASVTVGGTSFQRYLKETLPVDEVEIWEPGGHQPWPRARH